MPNKIEIAFRDRDSFEKVKANLLTILDGKLADLGRLRALAPVSPLDCDRSIDPIGFNKLLASYSYAAKNQAEAEASIIRSIKPLFDLLVDPDQIQAERREQYEELTTAQHERAQRNADAKLAIKQTNSNAWRDSLTKGSPADKAREEASQKMRDRLAMQRGQYAPGKVTEHLEANSGEL